MLLIMIQGEPLLLETNNKILLTGGTPVATYNSGPTPDTVEWSVTMQ